MDSLNTQLARLENAQLVRRALDEDLAYLFNHTLTQEAAYGSLLAKKRREIHRRAAESIEHLYPDQLDEYAARLAQHFAEAGDDAKTLEYATRAGDVAARTYANAEAIAHYSLALQAAERSKATGEQLLHLFGKRGRAFELSSQYERALDNYNEMEAAARLRGDRSLELESYMLRAVIRATPTPLFDVPQAQSLADQALALSREMGDPASEAKLLWILQLMNFFAGHTPKAVEYGEQALTLARKFKLREQEAYVLNNLSYPYLSVGRTEEGMAVAIEALELWRELDNRPMLADTLGVLAENDYVLGEFDRALDYGDQGLSLSQRIGNLWGQSYSQFFIGHVYWERGDPARAIEIMRECIRLAEQAGFSAPQISTRADLGWVYASLGAVETGLQHIRLAQSVGQLLPVFSSWVLPTFARVYLLYGDLASAEEMIKAARAVVGPKYLGILYPTIAVNFGFADIELMLARQEHTRAADLADQLVQFTEAARMRTYIPEARYLAAEARLRQGQREQALEGLTRARAVAEAIGSRRMLWRILAALSEIQKQEGNLNEAEQLLAEARTIVQSIADHTPSELRQSFLNLPGVRAVMIEAPVEN